MKYKIFILFVFSVMIFSPVVKVRAAECTGSYQTMSTNTSLLPTLSSAANPSSYQTMSTNTSIGPRADIIIRKYRVFDGVVQYRRWNKTQCEWADDDWINL